MVKAALIGVGTVGSGVIHIYKQNKSRLVLENGEQVILKTLCDKDCSKCPYDLSEFQQTSDWRSLLADPEIDIIIELIGGEEPARTMIEESLKHKKNVVTANKLVIAKYGKMLLDLAAQNNVHLLFEASVGGSIPIIGTMRRTLIPNQIESLYGIVNGTTNYILTKMVEDGADFGDVLKEAQELGYAEADPTSDVGGFDSQYKLKVLAMMAFGVDVPCESIMVEGITEISAKDINYAKEMQSVIKLLAIAKMEEGQLELRVHPVMLSKNHPLAAVSGVFNAIYIIGDMVGDQMFYGRGAGSIPTASSVWSDIQDIANSKAYSTGKIVPTTIKSTDDIKSEYYFRFRVEDKPGVLADISGAFARNNISIKTAIQRGYEDEAELVIVSHIVSEKNKNQALKEIASLKSVEKVASVFRVGIK